MRRRLAVAAVVATVSVAGAQAVSPPPARAVDLAKPICTLAGLISKLAGTVCTAARKPGAVLSAGKQLLGGHLGSALESLGGVSPVVKTATAAVVVEAIVRWAADGAQAVLDATAKVISATTRPQLQSTWFSASYWRMAAIAALLTLPFVFAAAIQALLRSDPSLLVRSAFGYLPLGLLGVSLATPVIVLLLSASDEMSALIAGATGNAPGAGLAKVSIGGSVLSGLSGSTFILFFVALLTVVATVTLWVELLIRSAAMYVIVLMLPLFFAALVWPARRIWAVRAIELLIALILSKFVIVAVLSLGGAAIGHATPLGVTQGLAGATLVLLAALSPWALLRLLPLHELAAGVEGLHAPMRTLPLGGAEEAGQAGEAARTAAARLDAQVDPSTEGAPEPTAAQRAVQGLGAASGPAEPADAPPAAGPPGDGADPVDGASPGGAADRALRESTADGAFRGSPAGGVPPAGPAPTDEATTDRPDLFGDEPVRERRPWTNPLPDVLVLGPEGPAAAPPAPAEPAPDAALRPDRGDGTL